MSANQKYPAILMFGGPGSGKGTQGVALGQLPNLLHMAMGDIFRALDKQSPIGREFLSYSTKGLLVPDELTIRVWQSYVDQKVAAGTYRPGYHTLLLDGIPRTPAQVELMSTKIEVRKIVHLVIKNREVLVARLKGRALKADRPDDADEKVIRKRLEVYDQETAPVLSCYDRRLVSEVNADQAPLAVLRDICETLSSCVPAEV